MSIRKRKWTYNGETKETWVVDYVDGDNVRRMKTFRLKKDADAYRATVQVDLQAGVRTAERASPTVAEAGELWIKTGEQNGLERSTMEYYRQHLDLHIAPFLGKVRLSQLTAPMVRKFEDKLRQKGRSPVMARRAVRSLGSILADALERGSVRHNVVQQMRNNSTRGRKRCAERRQNGKLKIGVDIPTPDEINALIPHLGRWRPLILIAIFTGLRASELRGLRWEDVDLKAGEIHVRQRADRYNEIGAAEVRSRRAQGACHT